MAIVADGLRCFDVSDLPNMILLSEHNEKNLPGFSAPVSLVVHPSNDDIIITSNWK